MNRCNLTVTFLIFGISSLVLSLCPSDEYSEYSTSCVPISEPELVGLLEARKYVPGSKNNDTWCWSAISYDLLDSSSGRVEFGAYFRHDVLSAALSTAVTIEFLLTGGDQPNSNVHSTFRAFGSHTTPCSDQQFSKLVWVANYISSGRYQLSIDNPTAPCKPLKFNFTGSEFKDDAIPFANFSGPSTKLDMSPSASWLWSRYTLDVEITSDQLQNDCGVPLISSSCVVVSLQEGVEKLPVYSDIWSQTFYKSYNESSTMCPPFHNNSRDPGIVSCEWLEGCDFSNEKPHLRCRIFHAPPGLYTLNLVMPDTRCKLLTKWTARDTPWERAPCTWTIQIDVKDYFSWFLRGCAALGILISVVISHYLLPTQKMAETSLRYLLRLRIFVNHQKINRLRHPGSPKVLLLYTRDCDPVMRSMSQLRKFLIESVKAEVFDIWDESQAEHIAACGGYWAPQYLMDEQVDIVLVTTPLVSRYEKALSKGLIADHSVKDSRDDDFLVAFKTATVLNLQNHSHRIIVLRLNKEKWGEGALTCFVTNSSFLLPEDLRRFVSYLLGTRKPNVDFSAANFTSLVDAIKAFKDYLSSNPNYSEGMLVTRSPSSVEDRSVYSFISNFNDCIQKSTCSDSSYVIDWLRQVSADTAPSVVTPVDELESRAYPNAIEMQEPVNFF